MAFDESSRDSQNFRCLTVIHFLLIHRAIIGHCLSFPGEKYGLVPADLALPSRACWESSVVSNGNTWSSMNEILDIQQKRLMGSVLGSFWLARY